MLNFNDGESFDTDGELRIDKRYDGYYIVGEGMLVPVRDEEQGWQMIAEFKAKKGKR